MADLLGVTTDYLIEGATEEVAKAKLEDRELLRQFQEVEELPEEDKYVIKKTFRRIFDQKENSGAGNIATNDIKNQD